VKKKKLNGGEGRKSWSFNKKLRGTGVEADITEKLGNILRKKVLRVSE